MLHAGLMTQSNEFPLDPMGRRRAEKTFVTMLTLLTSCPPVQNHQQDLPAVAGLDDLAPHTRAPHALTSRRGA